MPPHSLTLPYTHTPSPLHRRAFTMVELLVVLSIIAILAAILFPVFARARETTRQMSCRGNLHQIGIALQLYARDYDGRLPAIHHDFRSLAVPYVNSLAVFRCPTDDKPMRLGGAKVDQFSQVNQFGNPYAPLIQVPAGAVHGSYQYRGGFTTQDRGELPVAADWSFRHTARANVLYLSGEVRGLSLDMWKPVAPGPRPEESTLPGPEGTTPFLSLPGSKPTPAKPVASPRAPGGHFPGGAP